MAGKTYVLAFRKPGEDWVFLFDGLQTTRLDLWWELILYAADDDSLMTMEDARELLSGADRMVESLQNGWE